jgi:hypothetical protein
VAFDGAGVLWAGDYEATGQPGQFVPMAGRTTGFLNTKCEKAGACAAVPWSACEDGNPCTVGFCKSSDGKTPCVQGLLPEGSSCSLAGNKCTAASVCQ